MAVIVPIVSKFDDKGIKEAQKGFTNIGKSMKSALGGLGVGLGISAIVAEMKAAGVAASQDVKSQALLANQLRDTIGATDAQVASVESQIAAMQRMAAVADDEIRPAFGQLVRATGDLDEASRLTNLALNVSAATGKDLTAVSVALGKAFQGSTGALAKLGINVKNAKDPLAELETQFAGAAATAAENDPYQRLSIAFQDIQEKIGIALLPALNDLADWLSDPANQADVASYAETWGSAFGTILDSVSYLLKGLTVVSEGLGALFNGDFAYAFDILGVTSDMPIEDAYKRIQAKAKADAKASKDVATEAAGRFQVLGALSVYKPKLPPTPTPGGGGAAKAANDAAKAASDAAKKFADAYQAILDTEAAIAEEAMTAAMESRAATMAMRDAFSQLYDGVKPLARAAKEIGQFEQQVVDSFAAIEEQITSSLADGTLLQDAADNLRAYAASERNTLAAIARQRDAISKKLDIAKAISSDVLAFGNINGLLEKQTKTVTETFTRMVNGIQVATSRTFEEITSGGLVDNFKKVIDKTKAFAKNLIELKRLGLNGQLFKQIVDAGVSAGGDTAQAIAEGGQSTVSELNDLFGQLNDLGGQVAAASTDVMYQAGTDVMNSFIQSLLDQDAALQSTAMTLAENFANTFKKTLESLAPLMAIPMPTGEISLQDALTGFVSDQYGRTFTGPYNYYGQQSVGNAPYNYTFNINAGAITDKSSLPQVIVDALATYTRTSGTGALNRVLNL
jgi:hypothetical protein